MKAVFIKNNKFKKYDNLNINGYKFIPRRKSIDYLVIVNSNLINKILFRKINKELKKVKKTIELIISSNVSLIEDCDMMGKELIKILNTINNKYMNYFNQFEYFDFIKEIYILHNTILLKSKLIESEGI